MKLEPFLMERWQSLWENRVDYNLSESSVHPLRVEELIDNLTDLELLAKISLGYIQTNGTPELRSLISSLYPGSTLHHIQVTNGSAEANFLCLWNLVEPGDEIVLMLPNYMQIWGIARSFGGAIKPFRLREELGWMPNLDDLRKAVTPKTRLIAVCHPNNPTGSLLTVADIMGICDIAGSVGAWILADEVYIGSERNGATSLSFWGHYDRLLVVNGLSKAYGLPGLRIGWLVAPPDFIQRIWAAHDYTTIAPTAVSDALAQIALAPGRREKILERTREICRGNFPILANWVTEHREIFEMVPPRAGAIAYLKYHLPINSTTLVERLRREKSVLIVAGDHFGMDNYVRIGYGQPPDYLAEGLMRISELLQFIKQE